MEVCVAMNTDKLLLRLADQLAELSQTVRHMAEERVTAETSEVSGHLDHNLSPEEWLDLARKLHPAIGERQEEVMLEVAKAHPRAVTTGQVSKAISYEPTNTNLVFVALARQGLIRKDETTRPFSFSLGGRLLGAAS
jgi:hypothetical protein